MAFQRQERNEWEAVASVSPEPPKAPLESNAVRGHTPIESLNSSESDFPREMESESEGDDKSQTLRRDAVLQGGWSDGTSSLSNSLEKENAGEKSAFLHSVEEVDVPLDATTPAVLLPTAVELTGETQDDCELSDRAVNVADAEVDPLDKTLTPTKQGGVFAGGEANGCLLPPEALLPQEGDYTRRSGTYRKNKPSLSPVPIVTPPEGGHHLELGSNEPDAPLTTEAGDYLKRSGTFKKNKPVLNSTVTANIALTTQSIDAETTEVDLAHTTDAGEEPVVEDRRTDDSNFNTNQETLSLGALEEPDLQDSDELMVTVDYEQEEGITSGTGLKRSGTFRKEKPTLEVSPIIREDTHSSTNSEEEDGAHQQQPEDFEYLYSNRTPELRNPLTASLTVPNPQSAHSESDRESVEESYVMVDNEPAGGGELKRSGTFTKERPALEHSPFGDDYF